MLVLKTLLFTIIAPCTLTLFVPYLILAERRDLFPDPWNAVHYAGCIVFLLGILIYLWCAGNFIRRGKGTPAPYDPPKKLVVNGLYEYTRNPMYVGVVSILLGETIFFKSLALLVYASVLLVGFHLRVVYYEEPTLKRLFGDAWEQYENRVPRWIPVAKKRKAASAVEEPFRKEP